MSPTLFRLVVALIVAVSAVGSSATARAELLARESFDYDAAGALTGNNGGLGWDGPWRAASGAARIGPHKSEVAVADGGGYFGNQVLLDGNTRVGRLLDVFFQRALLFLLTPPVGVP